jgi:hypothetical protein
VKGLAKWWQGDHIEESRFADNYRLFFIVLWAAWGGYYGGRAVGAFQRESVADGFYWLILVLLCAIIVFFYIRGHLIQTRKHNSEVKKAIAEESLLGYSALRKSQSEEAGIRNAQLAEIQSKDRTIAGLQRELESRPPAQIM